jgi:hypothetical protein
VEAGLTVLTSLVRSKSCGRQASQMKDFVYAYILVSQANQRFTTPALDVIFNNACSNTIEAMSAHLAMPAMANRNRCCVQSDSKARAFEKYLKSRSGREFTRRHLDFALQHSENVRLRGNAGRAGAFEPSETNI